VPLAILVVLFYTIVIDFVIALLLIPSSNDYLLIITDKFTKRILLVPGNKT